MADVILQRGTVLWRAAPGHLALCTADGNAISVDGPAAHLWAALDESPTEEQLVTRLADLFGAETAVVAADVSRLLLQLREHGFVVESAIQPG